MPAKNHVYRYGSMMPRDKQHKFEPGADSEFCQICKQTRGAHDDGRVEPVLLDLEKPRKEGWHCRNKP